MTRSPLTWPAGWPRTASGSRKYGHFGVVSKSGSWPRKRDLTVSDGVERVRAELQRLGVREGDSIISTNLPTRLDGLPRSDAKAPADPGVAVYWQVGGAPMRTMAVDIYTTVADNLAAIAATLEAMRAIERHGGAQVLERAFAGFDALPAPGATKQGRKRRRCVVAAYPTSKRYPPPFTRHGLKPSLRKASQADLRQTALSRWFRTQNCPTH